MEAINNLRLKLEGRYGSQVDFASYNIFYDDTEEVKDLVEHVWHERVGLPATFIDKELCLHGYIDEGIIRQALENRGLIESPSP